jgi:outer membrane translocation and assembly module TamA
VIRAFAGGGSLIEDATYAHYGAEATYYLAPFWARRVFVGRIALEGVRDKDNDIPFTELPRLGGAGLLRGFHTDEFRDQLATIATLEYHYPIHELISGHVFVETGKVAHTYDALLGSGFTDHWHTGVGGGLIVHSRSSVKARIDIAYGDGLAVYFSTDVLDAFRKREREL